ncbi:MAG: hypothetical protein JWM31_2339, partial [Solirubrobacterales bacterium]|nr:hypothetical protein [Solirubrobacterales bacterium]
STVSQLLGRIVRVAGGPEAVAAGDPQAGPPLALAPVPDSDLGDAIPVWAVPAGVVLLALLAAGAFLARRRWGSPRRT